MTDEVPAPTATCPPSVTDRVRLFRENWAEYHSPGYNEASLRNNFLRALFHDGFEWDVDNDAGAAEAYRDVVVEETLNRNGLIQRLDYVFRIGGTAKFIVEAKKPSVDILDAQEPALQLRRYGWNKKLPLCVLTNFEAFTVYDTRIRPKPDDGPGVARLRQYTFEEYPTKWQELWGVYSHPSVLSGRFDREAQRQPTKGREEVDEAFLREIESWREALAKNLKLRNPSLNRQELNFAVQAIIDRIIFIRICEDRGVEPPGRLKSCVGQRPIYAHLVDLFTRADQRYDSGIFHFETERNRASEADSLTPRLKVDDDVIEPIISRLYPPTSPYDFSVLPVEILGQVYERFLGQVIEVTEKRARVEPKPEVRKAGGVYYTPSFIVSRIVRETLRPLTEGKTPDEVANLRVVDPACGSGSFLLGAYQYLLDWHLGEYGKNPRRWRDRITQVGDSSFALVSKERRRILLNNIFGVDIDPQAVEVTKLSLLLRVLEKTPGEVLDKQLKLSHERALPDLDTNIRCGNSLLDYRQVGRILLDDDTRRRVNPADWAAEFPTVFAQGGFDAVIGNPPYVPIQTMKEWAPVEVELYKKNYSTGKRGNFDIYGCFIERAIGPPLVPPLLRPSGRLGYIVPHKFFNSKYGEPLRTILSSGRHVNGIVHFGDQQVFEGATTYTCLLFLTEAPAAEFDFQKVQDLSDWRLTDQGESARLPASALGAGEWNISVGKALPLREKLDKISPKLSEVSELFVGLQTSDDPVYVFEDTRPARAKLTPVRSKASQATVELETELLKPVTRRVGGIGRYWGCPTALVLFPYKSIRGEYTLIPAKEMNVQFPRAWGYLTSHKARLSKREGGKFADSEWYRIYPKNLDVWEKPKVMLPYMITRLSAYYDVSESFFVNVTTGGFGLTATDSRLSLKYLTGLLNSKLLDWYLKQVSTNFQGGYFAANKQFLDKLPIRLIDPKDKADSELHDQIVHLVDAIQSWHVSLRVARTEGERVGIERQIAAAEDQIDQIVYGLYGLTADEMNLVEELKIPVPKGRRGRTTNSSTTGSN